MAILVAENEDLKMQIKSLKDKFEILAEEIETARVKNEIRALHAKWTISFFGYFDTGIYIFQKVLTFSDFLDCSEKMATDYMRNMLSELMGSQDTDGGGEPSKCSIWKFEISF